MPGTIEGGLRAAKTNKKRHGKGFYSYIGAKGGKVSGGGGFKANPELARIAAMVGGRGGWSKLSPSEVKHYKQEIKEAKEMAKYGEL